MKKILLLLLLLAANKITFSQCNGSAVWTFSSGVPEIIVIGGATGTSGPVSYSWDFGDGSPIVMGQNATHTYPFFGSFNLCLTIEDSLGCIDTTCYTISFPPRSVDVFALVSPAYFCSAPQGVSFDYNVLIDSYYNTDTFKVEINFGDGTDTIYYQLLNNIISSNNFFHLYQNSGIYTLQLIITSPDSLSDSITSQPMLLASSCGNISGIAYNDVNGNCVYDAGEELANIPLEANDGTVAVGSTSTDSVGAYSFNLPVGPAYNIHVLPNHHITSCPSNGIISTAAPSTGNNFGVYCPSAFDLDATVHAFRFRPGFDSRVCVDAENHYCNTPSGQIILVFPPEITPLADTGTIGYTISGDSVIYPINSPEVDWSFCLPVTVSPNAVVGDTICIAINILPASGDSFPANNTGNFCFVIRGSLDPNDKYVIPEGDGPQGLIRPNTPLTYTVRFQNTGSAEAVNIFILDTIDSDLDLTSLEVLGASHPMTWSILNGNILRFSFDNINLADSNPNEPASHGYVSYRINEKSSAPQLAEIKNTAAIYFDFNPPVITNTTLNTIDQFLEVKPVVRNSSILILYPNPAQKTCTIIFADEYRKNILINDLMGRKLFMTSTNADSYQLNTEKYPDGIYSINVYEDGKLFSVSKMIIRH